MQHVCRGLGAPERCRVAGRAWGETEGWGWGEIMGWEGQGVWCGPGGGGGTASLRVGTHNKITDP